jgi:hypothetical protein
MPAQCNSRTIVPLSLLALITLVAMGAASPQTAADGRGSAAKFADGPAAREAALIKGLEIPAGYRDWRLISVAHEEGKLNDLRAVLGNDIAIAAAREGKLPYPDGAIIVRVAWSYDLLAENELAFGRPQAFVAGAPKNGVQFMIKDSRKYAANGGWGFAQFDDGKLASDAVNSSCVSCHAIAKSRDSVFNHYAP